VLGLDSEDTVLLMLTAVASLLTFGTGRTNILYSFVHLVIFATFLFLVFVPYGTRRLRLLLVWLPLG
jgi:Ca2+:H+ antiporter